jgi:SAM-dependent methyltransferase
MMARGAAFGMAFDLLDWFARRKPPGTTRGDLVEPAPISGNLAASPRRSLAYPAPPRKRGRMWIMRSEIPEGAKILEISPLANPCAPKNAGYQSYRVDRLGREDLLKYYADHPLIEFGKIEEVDFVWKSGELIEHVPKEHHGSFDVVIASHVLEHIPNPVAFIRSLELLLKPGGCITLAIPDKRFCFDFFRPPTVTSDWLVAMDNRGGVHSAKTMFDFHSFAVARSGRIGWRSGRLPLDRVTPNGKSLENCHLDFLASRAGAQPEYVDAHAWVFTPANFTLVLNELHALELLKVAPEWVSTRIGAEFFANLRLGHRRKINSHERIQLMAMSAREQAEGFRATKPA